MLFGENSCVCIVCVEKLFKDVFEYKCFIGDCYGVVNVFYYLGNFVRVQGDLEVVEYYLCQVLCMYEMFGVFFFIGMSNNVFVICCMFVQDFFGVDCYFDEVIKYFDCVGDEFVVLYVMFNKGMLVINMFEIFIVCVLFEEICEFKELFDFIWGFYDFYNYFVIVLMWEGNFEDVEWFL